VRTIQTLPASLLRHSKYFKPMNKILILGGTHFIGRNLIEKLLEINTYDITLFNRQKTSPDLFPDLKKIKGDRETDDINKVANTDWDFVIDLSCYYPGALNDFIKKLKGKVGRYIFISTISVYDLEQNSNSEILTENFKIQNCSEEETKDNSSETYGKRKAECERLLSQTEWLEKIILRPSIIYGKYDTTDRLYYWLDRIKQQNPFIVPNCKSEKVTLTYVTDLVNIIIKSLKIQNHSTTYNASTHRPFTLSEMIDKISNVKSSKIEMTNEQLLDNKIKPEEDIPLWFNLQLAISNDKLLRDFEINLTSFDQSIKNTIKYYDQLNWPFCNAGFDYHQEKILISKYKDDIEI
jgi:2'-hydroxyisoflavone reductase